MWLTLWPYLLCLSQINRHSELMNYFFLFPCVSFSTGLRILVLYHVMGIKFIQRSHQNIIVWSMISILCFLKKGIHQRTLSLRDCKKWLIQLLSKPMEKRSDSFVYNLCKIYWLQSFQLAHCKLDEIGTMFIYQCLPPLLFCTEFEFELYDCVVSPFCSLNSIVYQQVAYI